MPEQGRSNWTVAGGGLSLDLVAALAGDRCINEPERGLLSGIHRSRGDEFYTDALFVLTHRRFNPLTAEALWKRILQHKCDMSSRMERNVRIVVASLDYLSNLTGELQSATVIDESHVDDLLRLSQHDGLTGLYNHAYFYQLLDTQMQHYMRYGTAVSLMMLDIDDFKAINDRYGHAVGDEVLSALARLVQGMVREADRCCRYSGEKFAVILPSTNASRSAALAERLRLAVAEADLAGHSLTVSIGAASGSPDTASTHTLVRRADVALYQAKHDGRNRTVSVT